jgi:protoheme IX farnesyltransferase
MKSVLKSYAELVKFRLSSTVVATSIFGYILALKYAHGIHWTEYFNWTLFCGVLFGGMFIVFASNGLNQIIEKENDGKMDRTSKRPIVEGRIPLIQARIFCWATGFLGIMTLILTGAPFLAVLLGAISLFVYVFIYTPMKQVSPLAVMVGAIPGALPPLIGYSAVIPSLDQLGIVLFLIQFFWQFPHFWAIAWMLHDDYQKAGYWLLPSGGGRDKKSAYQILIYTVILNLVSLMPLLYGVSSVKVLIIILPLCLYFFFKSLQLFKTLEIKDARKLLYASFLYTPVVFLSYIFF